MSGLSSASLSPRDLVYILFRHKKKAIAFFLAMVTVSMAAVMLLPPTYSSDAKLFLRRGRESVAIDPTATASGPMVSLMETRENEINSIIVALQSRRVAEAIVDRVGVERVIEGKLPEEAKENAPRSVWLENAVASAQWLKDAALAPLRGPEVSRREKAIGLIEKGLGVGAPRKANIVDISYTSDSPGLAQAVVQAAVDAYHTQHLEAFRSRGSYEFFVEQERQVQEQLREAERKLRDTKNELGLTSVEDQRKILGDRIAAIETQLLTATAELTAAQARVEALQNELERTPDRVFSQATEGPNTGADALRDELYKLEIRERELLSKYRQTHPLVVAVREQVQDAQAILEALPAMRTQTTNAIHPARQQLEVALHTERPAVEALKARRGALLEQFDLVMEEQRRLNEGAVQLADLEREAAILAANHRTYAGKLEESRINDQLEAERISNISVIQPATFKEKPTGPPRKLILLLGLAAGLSGALALALACEHFDDSLKSPEEVERQLDLPVLLSIPRMEPASVLLHQAT